MLFVVYFGRSVSMPLTSIGKNYKCEWTVPIYCCVYYQTDMLSLQRIIFGKLELALEPYSNIIIYYEYTLMGVM